MSAVKIENQMVQGYVPEISNEELQYFCKTIEALAGIHMKAAKHDLVKTRLRSRLAETGSKNYQEYRKYLEGLPQEHTEWQAFINLLTTNKTDFFREIKHFDYIVNKVLPEWLATGEKTLKIWSAASSTGEEAYSLAMLLSLHLPADRDFKILATDIDTNVISHAQNAVYPMSKLHEIPEDYRECLDIGKGSANGWFRIKRELKDKVVFKQHNLIEETSPGEEVFDMVFCRNVMIYFSKEVIQFVSQKLHGSTKTNGYFFIGHSESLQGIKHPWKNAGPSVFKKASR